MKHAWNVSSSWCSTEQVTRPVLMRPGSNVCTKGSSIWCYPTNQGGPVTAHKQSCLSSWSLLGPSTYTKPRSTFTRGLGMDIQRGRRQPFWTTLPDVTKSCKELLRCGCKRGCRGGCSCTRATLKCTALCSRNDESNNRWLQSVVWFNTKYRTMMWVKWNNFWWHGDVRNPEFCYDTS